jgi:hypothetical protein
LKKRPNDLKFKFSSNGKGKRGESKRKKWKKDGEIIRERMIRLINASKEEDSRKHIVGIDKNTKKKENKAEKRKTQCT